MQSQTVIEHVQFKTKYKFIKLEYWITEVTWEKLRSVLQNNSIANK